MGVRQGREGGKVDKGEKEKRTIKTHEDLVIYQKAFEAAITNSLIIQAVPCRRKKDIL
jgi:hypothetical protein